MEFIKTAQAAENQLTTVKAMCDGVYVAKGFLPNPSKIKETILMKIKTVKIVQF